MQPNGVRTERSQKRVRVIAGGRVVADSRHPLLVWEKPYYPTYYFPEADVAVDLLAPEDGGRRSPELGQSRTFTVKAEGRDIAAGAYSYPDAEPVAGHIAFPWRKMDHWFEEDEEVYVHPRDPHTRVDVLSSSRHVRIEIDGTTVADTTRPTLLFETGLPVRYYLPKTDVRLDLLEASDHLTQCPYKGTAEYWAVVVGGRRHENIVWSYPFPARESVPIAGLMCFYDERVDVYVDDEKQERPRTAFG